MKDFFQTFFRMKYHKDDFEFEVGLGWLILYATIIALALVAKLAGE